MKYFSLLRRILGYGRGSLSWGRCCCQRISRTRSFGNTRRRAMTSICGDARCRWMKRCVGSRCHGGMLFLCCRSCRFLYIFQYHFLIYSKILIIWLLFEILWLFIFFFWELLIFFNRFIEREACWLCYCYYLLLSLNLSVNVVYYRCSTYLIFRQYMFSGRFVSFSCNRVCCVGARFAGFALQRGIVEILQTQWFSEWWTSFRNLYYIFYKF